MKKGSLAISIIAFRLANNVLSIAQQLFVNMTMSCLRKTQNRCGGPAQTTALGLNAFGKVEETIIAVA